MFNNKSFTAMMALLLAVALAQDPPTPEPTTGAVGIFKANAGIARWINPNAFVGITIVLVVFWVCYCVLGMLAQVQTPRIMLEKTIDWGKVERTEE